MPTKNFGYIKPCIYLDNNGTTFPPPQVMKAVTDAMRFGNASTDYASEGKKLIKKFTLKVKSRVDNPNCEVIITSGASESNNLFLRSMAEMFPNSHFILSSIEHGTSLACAHRLENLGRIKLSLVDPRSDGCIHVDDIAKKINSKTRVISVMHINNETGSINDIEGIQKLCRKNGIIYHSDTVQSFGKYKLPNLDACSVSFHKMYGPQGVGCLILDHRIIFHGFPSQISGSQNHGLRGGTENLPAISGALKAMELTFKDREKKNARLRKMKKRILDNLGQHFEEEDFSDYVGKSDHFRGFSHEWNFMQIGGKKYNGSDGAPNVLLLSFNKSKSDPHHFCNVKAKKELYKNNCFVSIGSACHTKAKGSSHVLKAMKAPFIVRCGVIRISIGDYNTLKECDEFCRILKDCIMHQNNKL